MKTIKLKINEKIYIFLFVLLSIIFSIPSIVYLIQNKTVHRFTYMFNYFFRKPLSQDEKSLNGLIFFILFSLMFIIYFQFLKKHKQIFKNRKQIYTLIIVVSILFMIIIPYTSSDIYSYIASGWESSHYGENPYYVSIGQISDETEIKDQMFNKVAKCWRYETVVYGPLWTIICTMLTSVSFGNIDIALYIFKLVSLIIHIINCVLIYRTTKKNLFLILYGLNPFILFEALTNVHNDIFIIFFLLLAIYFCKKKKNLFVAVAFIAMATAIKYLAILFLPFIVLYCVREKDVKDRIKCCIYCGIEYISIIIIFYCFYVKDLNVLAGLFIQQTKYNRSILFLLYYRLKDNNMQLIKVTQNIILLVFTIYYIYVVMRLLFQKQIRFYDVIKKYNKIILFFTFVVITNFNPWYVMWLFPTIFWLKGKSIKTILNISYACQMGNILNFILYSEDEILGIPYFIIMLSLTLLLNRVKNKKEIKGG